MGYCSPNYRKSVKEKEEHVNQKGKDTIPFRLKVMAVIILVCSLTIAFVIK